jgi:hypothetical protein
LADWCLQHRLCQSFPHLAVELLRAAERGDADVDEASARRLLQVALQARLTAEIVVGREARS